MTILELIHSSRLADFFLLPLLFISWEGRTGGAADKVGHGAKRDDGESVHRTNFIRVNPYTGVDPGAEGW